MSQEVIYTKEVWTGDSRDGAVTNGEGSHFFRMHRNGRIVEAYEVYEDEEGKCVVTPLPDLCNVSWIDDLGFQDLGALDFISEKDFQKIKDLCSF